MSESMEEYFKTKATQIIEALRVSFRQKDKIATGDTINSIRSETTSESLYIIAPGHIGEVQTGTPPGRQPTGFEARLQRWAQARGWRLNIETLAKRIEEKGTLQYQSGTSNEVVSSVVNQQLVNEIATEVKDILRKQNKNFIKTIWKM